MKGISHLSKLLFIVFLVFAFNNIYGRSEYLPGYIIKLPCDTIHGFIKYRNWSETPTKIFFKQQKESDIIKEYTCADLNGFKVLDEIYVRAVVKIDESKLNADNLDFNNDLLFITDTVFLETMVQGQKSLYYYGNKSIKAQFYIKQDSTYELLIYNKYLNEQGSRYTENKRYLNQLALYLDDCSDIKEYFTNTTYTKQSLEKLFMRFYNCTNSEIIFQKKTEKTIFQSSILAGISVTSLSFTGAGYPYLISSKWDNSVNFTGGGSFNLIFPRNLNKLSFNNELLYTEYMVKGIFTDYKNDNDYTVNTSEIGLSYLKYNSMLRYSQSIANAFIFINSGISCGFAFNQTNRYIREKVFYSETSVKEFNAIADIRNLEIAYNIGIGSKYKKYSAEIRYERGNGFSDFETLKVRSKRLYFLLGFSF